jgi:hypothetical protein
MAMKLVFCWQSKHHKPHYGPAIGEQTQLKYKAAILV